MYDAHDLLAVSVQGLILFAIVWEILRFYIAYILPKGISHVFIKVQITT